ncbi:MAG: VanZ family protein [Bacteriovoracaceae bacterium]|nr:VanZ family protein [Bacteriovoracaceae bacterium]
MNKYHFNKFWNFLGILGLALILIVSVISEVPHIDKLNFNDKLAHLSIYLIASFYITQLNFRAIKIIITLIAYGAFIEGLQYLNPNRMAEFADIIANTLGVLIGTYLSIKFYPKLLEKLDRFLFNFLTKLFR